MSLDHVLHNTSREESLKAKARKALDDGRITKAEYAYYVRAELGEERYADAREGYAARATKKSNPHRKATGLRALALFTFIALFLSIGWLTTTTNKQPTGYATLAVDVPETTLLNETFTSNATIALDAGGTTQVKVTGTVLNGEAWLYALIDGERLLLYNGTPVADEYTVWTPYESYAYNESVTANVTASNASYTLWLTDENGTKNVVTSTFTPSEPGAYTLDALINDSGIVAMASTDFVVRNDTNTSRDVARRPVVASLDFNEECGLACALNTSENATIALQVVVAKGASVLVKHVETTVQRENQAPVQLKELPDVTLDVGESLNVDLSEYFTDPDADALTFDVLNAPGFTLTIEGVDLTVTANNAGTAETIVYASDLYALAQSNSFTLTAIANESGGVVNESETNDTIVNDTTTNETVDTTTNETRVPPGLCNNPNVNKRPLECLQAEPDKYFKAEPLYITTTSRTHIARLTPIGNLILKGRVVENTNFTANVKDYVIGYEDAYGDFKPTIWFDSKSGNVYLKGFLFEENENNVPTPGSYALRNTRGVTLAWADKAEGNLYLRGNVVEDRGVLG